MLPGALPQQLREPGAAQKRKFAAGLEQDSDDQSAS
jgi:hypothetical protein